MTENAVLNTDKKIKAENPFMTEAIAEAVSGIGSGHGGPFGSVIVKDGRIVGYDRDNFIRSWIQMGRQAVSVCK